MKREFALSLSKVKVITKNKFIAIGVALLLLDIILGIIGSIWTPYSVNASFSFSEPPSWKHLLGTDAYGHDVLSEMLHDTLPTLEVGFGVGALVALLSTIIGLLGGYYAGKTASIIIDIITITVLTIPGVILLVVISSYFRVANISVSYGITILSLSIVGWAFGARQIRSQVLSLSNREYIIASKLIGEKSYTIIFTQLLPPILPLAFAQFLFGTLYGVLSLVTAEFWGVLPATSSNLGTMLAFISTNAAYVSNQWWWILGAIIPIIILGTGIGFLNIGIDEFVDPRLREIKLPQVRRIVKIPTDNGVIEVSI
jgi:peptide/nickel transport system permease protein